jgi:hypothetical protein
VARAVARHAGHIGVDRRAAEHDQPNGEARTRQHDRDPDPGTPAHVGTVL